MKILYEQLDEGGFLGEFGITRCFFKQLFTQRDHKNISMKPHFHTNYEILIAESGTLVYEAEGKTYTLESGQYLLLPPGTHHRVVNRSPQASNFSISLTLSPQSDLLPQINSCKSGTVSPRIWENIRQIVAENTQLQQLSFQMIAGNIWEVLVLLWRLCGMGDVRTPSTGPKEEVRLILAKEYISDNIAYAPTVSDVSAYCYLSTKQLTRLFQQHDQTTPADYIRSLRIHRIEKLLQDTALSLGQISELMHFPNVYYFNTYFKKHAGMAPGEFRKMHCAK